jgi:hypothetical protein
MRTTNIYQGYNSGWFMALIPYAATNDEKNTLSAIADKLLTGDFEVPETDDETGDFALFQSARKIEREIADRAVAKMRSEGFERRIPCDYKGDAEELQRDYALNLLLGKKPRGERRNLA